MSHRFLFPLLDDAGIQWLLRDEFTTDDAAPIQSSLATAGSATVGTETNTYTATQADDGTNWEIAETAGTPGFTLTMDFTAPVAGQSATRLIIYGYYDGNLAHTVNVDAYDWVTTSYDNVGTLPDAVGEAVHTFTLDADHTDSDGSIRIRINHTSAGNINHTLYLDWVYVQDLVRNAEPGPDTWDIVDTNNIMSISSSQVVFNGTPAANDGIFAGPFTRSAGVGFFFQIPTRTTFTGGRARFGFDAATAGGLDIGFDANSTTVIRIKYGTTIIDTVDISTATQFACIMRGTGGYLFFKNTSAVWTLLWVYDLENANQYAKVVFTAGAVNFTYDAARIAQLATPFTTDFGYATDQDAGSVLAGATFTHEADFFLEFTVTTLPTANNIDCFFRVQDADNYWIARVTSGGTLDLIEVVATAPTSRGSGGTVTDGERIVITAVDETITGYADNSEAWSYGSAANFKTETAGELDSLGTGGAVDDLAAFPIYPSGGALAQLNRHTT